jgi:hypothetical protein
MSSGSRLARLAAVYRSYISAPWQSGLAGAQRVIFAVYDKTDELKLRIQVEEFAIATKEAGHGWQLIDVTNAFPDWMAAHRYRESYFEDPASLEGLGDGQVDGFVSFLTEKVSAQIQGGADAQTLTAVLGVGALFGVAKVSRLVEEVAPAVPGRLLVFFPGEYADNNYRLLDARDGWNYLAVPLLASEH